MSKSAFSTSKFKFFIAYINYWYLHLLTPQMQHTFLKVATSQRHSKCICLLQNILSISIPFCQMIFYGPLKIRGVFRGGAIGAKPPPLDQWNLLISGGFHAPTGAEPSPLKEKNLSPPLDIWKHSSNFQKKKFKICVFAQL